MPDAEPCSPGPCALHRRWPALGRRGGSPALQPSCELPGGLARTPLAGPFWILRDGRRTPAGRSSLRGEESCSGRIVQSPWQYRWSSAAAHVRKQDDELVQVAPLLSRATDWKEFLRRDADEQKTSLLRRHQRTGRPLGGARFLKRLERKLGIDLQPKKRGPKGPWKHKPII